MEEQKDLSWLEMYMIAGFGETAYDTGHGIFDFLDINRTARSILEERGATLTYFEKDGGHQWGFWQKELPDGLMHFIEVEYQRRCCPL